jgi:hypothetical protein
LLGRFGRLPKRLESASNNNSEMEESPMRYSSFLETPLPRSLNALLRGSILLPLLALTLFSTAGFSQALSWATAERDTTTPIGGESQRPGVGAVSFNGYLYVAYLGTTTIDGAGDAYIYTAYNSGGTTFSNKHQVTVTDGQTVAAANNPALAVFNGLLYLVYTDGYGNTQFLHSADGVNWGSDIGFVTSGSGGSPSLAVFGPYLYVGLLNQSNVTLNLATIAENNTVTVINYPSVTLNFNPGLAVFNDVLYIAIETNANSHDIIYYQSTDGLTLSPPNYGAASDVLYLGFRSNDSKDNFLYKYTTNGTTWSSSIEPHIGIGGDPFLTTYNGDIYMLFASESSPNFYLCSTSAP